MPNFRKLLFPFSLVYQGVTAVRNKLYDVNVIESKSYKLPVIAVGNLNMGGTGKSPMIEYLLKNLGKDYKMASLSRGYKRKSRGFQMVDALDDASKAGDEPLQFKNNYPEALIAVDANRQEGIEQLMKYSPDVILLDDAFQHRKVKAGYYILLTAYGDLYADDLVLPAGNLRESSSGAARADIIVVTKCPENLGSDEMAAIKAKLRPELHQEVLFTTIKYADNINSDAGKLPLKDIVSQQFALVTGIANPESLIRFLGSMGKHLNHIKFPDHHNFSQKEIEALRKEKNILTTEKDYMRLKGRLKKSNLYYLPIEISFLAQGEYVFNEKVRNFINKKEV